MKYIDQLGFVWTLKTTRESSALSSSSNKKKATKKRRGLSSEAEPVKPKKSNNTFSLSDNTNVVSTKN